VLETPAEVEGGFKSPVRMLARFFRNSQQKWKKKAIERRAKIKDLHHKLRDIDTSRTGWRNKAQQWDRDKKSLEERLRGVESERARLQARVEELESKKA
jgi:predicted nuclease with TOPRIM domain